MGTVNAPRACPPEGFSSQGPIRSRGLPRGCSRSPEEYAMADLAFVIVTVAVFALVALVARG